MKISLLPLPESRSKFSGSEIDVKLFWSLWKIILDDLDLNSLYLLVVLEF